MIRHTHRLLLTAAVLGFSAMSIGPAEAGCHGNSGGRSVGSNYSRGIGQPYPAHSQPIYQQPIYPQPVYQQPPFQPVYQQPQYPPQGLGQPQNFGQSPQMFGRPQLQQPQGQTQFQQPQGQTQFQQPQGQPQGQTQGQFSNPGTATVSQQGGVPMTQNGNLQNPQFNQPAGPNAQQSGSPQAGLPQTNGFQNQAPSAPVTGGVASNGNLPQGNSSNANVAGGDAQQSALQALGGFAPPQSAAVQSATIAPPAQEPMISGNFTASLSNGARVELSLQADGRFSWVAVNTAGQSSSFEGSFQVDQSSLSLSRSSDGQTLSGSLTIDSANTFSFKLADAKSSSLSFVRN